MTITVHEIDRIARLGDPIIRNLQITHCYHESSRVIAVLVGSSANWCTFATWASKQAGVTIRQEDLQRQFEARFCASPTIGKLLAELQQTLRRIGAKLPAPLRRETILGELNPRAAFERAADAVARGNKKVFEEIGREFARFADTFAEDDDFDPAKMARFCAALRPGDPPDGQRLLSEAFTAYSTARFRNGKEQAELMLLGNICAGYHEQIRLQPEIAQALNAKLGDPGELRHRLMNLVLPAFYLRARAGVLQQRSTLLDGIFDRLIAEANRLIRQVITDHLMTLHLPGGENLRLGNDLKGEFPPLLKKIENARLREILTYVDRTADSLNGTGARDWANFSNRMHFIADFFRLYQERRELFDQP
jgi:hypothetical protein